MSGYRALYSDFWESPRVLDMSKEERLLFVYLITAPGAHYSGVYHITLSRMVEETGLEEWEVKSALDTLSRTLCVDYDYPMRTVFVHNLAKKEVKSPQQIHGAQTHLREKIRSISILEKFSSIYPEILKPSDIPYPIGYPIPSPHPSFADIDRVNEESELGKKEKENTPPPEKPADGFALPVVAPVKVSARIKKNIDCPPDVDPMVWTEFLSQCKAKDKPCTQIVMFGRDGTGGIRGEALKANLSLTDALAWAVKKGYARFEAEWYLNDKAKGSEAPKDGCRSAGKPGKYDNL